MYWECRVPEMLWCVDLQLTVQFLGRRQCNSSCFACHLLGLSCLSVVQFPPAWDIHSKQSQYSTPFSLLYRQGSQLSVWGTCSLGRAYCWYHCFQRTGCWAPLQCCNRWSNGAQAHGINTWSPWFTLTLHLCPGFTWGWTTPPHSCTLFTGLWSLWFQFLTTNFF